MIVPTVLATTARRSCTRCSASDRREMEISDVVIVSSLRRTLLAAEARRAEILSDCLVLPSPVADPGHGIGIVLFCGILDLSAEHIVAPVLIPGSCSLCSRSWGTSAACLARRGSARRRPASRYCCRRRKRGRSARHPSG